MGGVQKMETASSSPALHVSHSNHHPRIGCSQLYCRNPRNQLRFLPLFPLTSFKTLIFHSKNLQFNVSTGALSSPSSCTGDNLSQRLAVLLEVDGVLMDVYRLGNRQAFNKAFQKLGLDCANWTEPVYADLLRRSAGDEERMLIIYFNRIGWPTSVPTSEKGAFVKSVLQEKKKALDDLVMSKTLPLRPGLEDFINDACKEGVPVIILTAFSKLGEKVARFVVILSIVLLSLLRGEGSEASASKVGNSNDAISKLTLIGTVEVEQSLYSQLVFGKGVSSSLDEQLAKEVAKAASAEKQKVAEEVASMLKLSVDIDTTSSESLQQVVAALRAGAEHAEIPLYNCVLIAGSQSGVAAAERIGMPCIVLRSSSTARAEFPSANAVMDGFGGADLTISRLRKCFGPKV